MEWSGAPGVPKKWHVSWYVVEFFVFSFFVSSSSIIAFCRNQTTFADQQCARIRANIDHPVRHHQTDQVRVADIGEGVGKGERIITVAGPSVHRGCQAIRQLRQIKRTSRFARSLISMVSVVFRLVRSWLFCSSGFRLRLFVARFWLADVG